MNNIYIEFININSYYVNINLKGIIGCDMHFYKLDIHVCWQCVYTTNL